MHDPRLRAFYLGKMKRYPHSVAITHVANKMIRIIWHMLTEDRLYENRNEQYYQTKLKRLSKIAMV